MRQIHKKDHSNEYFNFLDGFRNHEIPLGKIKTPRYTAGQQIHCFRINKITTALLMKPIDFLLGMLMIILKIWLFIKIAYRGFAVFHMKKWC